MALSKKAILEADDLKPVEVEVPEWGGSVYLKSMTAGEGIAFESAKADLDTEKVVGLMVAYCLVGEDGRRLFDDSEIDKLYTRSPAVLMRLFERARKLNQIDPESDGEREEKSSPNP